MISTDIPLSSVFGLEPASADDNTVTKESVGKILTIVREATGNSGLKSAAVRALDMSPGVLLELAKSLRSPLSAIAAGVWNKRKEIQKYADQKTYPPDETNTVFLYEHELKQTIKPTVTIRYAGVKLMTLTFSGAATITLHSAVLVIRGGRITHIQLGDVTAAVELGIEGAKAVSKELRTWKVPGAIKLGDGIKIPA